ncbi:cysteine hydrolase family protein [Terrimonas pollutisoli]|uniref:cysteine hydrolase family protein n=1 Tax=Terrimonas pollutisoli TaxID=3034147 RepID=UPI0023ECE49D|nr:cysteine hydrolase [Terrimonas sp. H1YJ31]
MDNECIVIIDPQKDFTSIHGSYARRHEGISQILDAKANINKLLTQIDKNRFVIVSSNYSINQFAGGLSICIPGTEGHEIDINANTSFTYVSKKEHSCFSSFEFLHYLNTNHIHKLVLCGFLAEYCVMGTATDALRNGYTVSLLEDCIGTGDDVQERKNKSLSELKKLGAAVVSHEDYLNYLYTNPSLHR